MSEPLAVRTWNAPGIAGVDLRSDTADLDGLALLDENNLDVLHAADGSRMRPRSFFRRFGQRMLPFLTSAQGTGSGVFTVNDRYSWYYKYTDGAGKVWYGYIALTIIAAYVDGITFTGWPTSAGTVDIYRTEANGSTFKTVATGIDVTANTHYEDNTTDGSLGATVADPPHVIEPLVHGDFDQTVLADFLFFDMATDRLSVIARDGATGTVSAHWAFLEAINDHDPKEIREFLHERPDTITPTLDQPLDHALLGGVIWIAVPSFSTGLYSIVATFTSSGATPVSIDNGFEPVSQPSAPTISLGTPSIGSLSPGTGYQWLVQVENTTTGIRSQPSNIISTGSGSNLQYPINGLGAGTKHIYRTTDGGSIFLFVATTTATNYTDDTSDNSLGEPIIFDYGAAQGFKHIEAHKNLLFVWNEVNGDASLLRWSSAGRPYNFVNDVLTGAQNELRVDSSDGDEGTGLKSWGSFLLVFKRRRVWYLAGEPPDNFTVYPVPNSEGLGCVAHRTIVETPIGVLYLSPAGIALLGQPGSAPVLISDALSGLFTEFDRERADAEALPERIDHNVRNDTGSSATYEFQIQLDDDSGFGSIDADYVTTNDAHIGHFRANYAPIPKAGLVIAAGATRRISLFIPSGLTPGTTYNARLRTSTNGGIDWNAWESAGSVTIAETPANEAINWDKIKWAFALHLYQREQVWFFVPTGTRTWCDRCIVLDYNEIKNGGSPRWHLRRIPATGGLVLNLPEVGSAVEQETVILAGPDGLLYQYPYAHGEGLDFDTRVTGVADVDRVGTGTRSLPVMSAADITVSGAGFPTTGYKLAGNMIAARDSQGVSYSGLIVDNTGTAISVVWLGNSPPAGELAYAIAGMDARFRSSWLQLGEGLAAAAVLRQIVVHTLGRPAGLNLTIRGSRAPDRDGVGSLQFSRPLAVGQGLEQQRYQINLRGNVHQFELGGINPNQRWELQQIELFVEPTQSRI